MSQSPMPEVRNFSFETDASVPRYWHGGRRSVTLFFNNLSVFFPPGERFFVASVKAFRERIAEPKLAAEVKAFCAQEGIHSREHVRYNDMLRAQGYPVDALEGRLSRLLRWVRFTNTKRVQLAVTVCLEHFTALMAEFLLGTLSPKLLEGAHPTMAALWRWHAAEENEHKAVAFDVYNKVGGYYLERAVVMLGTTFIFWFKVFEQQVRLMRSDGIGASWSEWRALVRYLFQPGGLQTLLRPYLAFFKPSFHPWQHDNRALLEDWKQEVKQSPTYPGVLGA